MTKLPENDIAYYLVAKGSALADACAVFLESHKAIQERALALCARYGAESAQLSDYPYMPKTHIAGLVFAPEKIPYKWTFNKNAFCLHPDPYGTGKAFRDFYGGYGTRSSTRYHSEVGMTPTRLDLAPFLPAEERKPCPFGRVAALGGSYILGIVSSSGTAPDTQLAFKHLHFPFIEGARFLPDEELKAMLAENPGESAVFAMDDQDWKPAPLRDPVFTVSPERMAEMEKGDPAKQFRLTTCGRPLYALYKLVKP